MEIQIEHFFHPDHPLILIDVKDTHTKSLIKTHKRVETLEKFENPRFHDVDATAVWCNCCGNEISGSAYSCITCDFHLHKLCTKLPTQLLKHPDHDTDHPLTLILTDQLFICNVCSRCMTGSTYRCISCDFDVDVRCAAEVLQAIDIEGHLHPLRPLVTPVLFRCHACAVEHPSGFSHKCNTCAFWIHEDCATLPTVIKYHRHVHPLSRVYAPQAQKKILGMCQLCLKYISRNHLWYYTCASGCYIKIHAYCLAATLIEERKRNKDENEVDDGIDMAKLFQLPTSFQHYDLAQQLIEHMISHDRNRKKMELDEQGLFSHFSHKHPLTVCNVSEVLFYSVGHKMKKTDKICNACVLPMSNTPVYYSCTICDNYILHKWCAELPIRLLDPLHRSSLTLEGTKLGDYGHSTCRYCGRSSNGLFYTDRIRVCIECARLPSAISHKVHKHPLKLIKDCWEQGCVACPRQSTKFAYGCIKCCYYLHSSCALQPIEIMHRYDKHPFILIYADIEDGPEEYVCEFCEKDIDPKWWFYHCLQCDQSACADCIFKKDGRKGHLNPCVTYSSEVHHHPLAFVQMDRTNEASLCSRCGANFCYLEYALQCAQCNTMYHQGKDCRIFSKFSGSPLTLVQEETS